MVHVSGGRGLHGVSEGVGVIWVQGAHSLGEKAVEQSGGAGSDAPVRLPDGRSWKRLWDGVGGVLHNAVGFAGASCKENV